MKTHLVINENEIGINEVLDYVFERHNFEGIEITPACREQIQHSHERLQDIIKQNIPLYGVTTGYGDSCSRAIPKEETEQLQKNLIAFLNCGTGKVLPKVVSRAISLIRLKSLSRGYSGVSGELVTQLKLFLDNDWLPVIPRDGSLGASGDLIPLSYLAQALQGEGEVYINDGIQKTEEVLKEHKVSPYKLKAKEGLAIVNGTSVMAGQALVNYNNIKFLNELAVIGTSWLCLAVKGRPEAFGTLVNEKGKLNPGQGQVAKWITGLLADEDYSVPPISAIGVTDGHTEQLVQNRYSLRCTPQVLGPVLDTLDLFKEWLELEINSTSDNPIIDDNGAFAMGGNFYGGYMAHGMDYLKICLGHIADLQDRQVMHIIDEKSNAGLPPNLADWRDLPEEERHLHHGLKGINMAVSAITSEMLAKATPNSTFSRSTESHNQDKVSLGMTAAVQCADMIDSAFTLSSMYLLTLAQAIDLSDTELKGSTSKELYELVRACVPFVTRDRSLESGVRKLTDLLKKMAYDLGSILPTEERQQTQQKAASRKHKAKSA